MERNTRGLGACKGGAVPGGSTSGVVTWPVRRRVSTDSRTAGEQLPSMKSARCNSPNFRSRNRLPASSALRLLLVTSWLPAGSVVTSTRITEVRAGRPQMLYLPSLSLVRFVPSCK